MSFRLVPKSATLNDLERRNGRCVISLNLVNLGSNTKPRRSVVDLCSSLLYFVVRVQSPVPGCSLNLVKSAEL